MRIRRKKNCFKCNKNSSELFRVKLEQRKNWIFICKICLQESKTESLFYQYGGTWKFRKAN